MEIIINFLAKNDLITAFLLTGAVIYASNFLSAKVIEKEYCQIEKLANLEQLPPFGFKVACFPAKIKGASAGWTRAVAILP